MSLNIPKEFYYFSSKSRIRYTHKMTTGRYNPMRAMLHLAPWPLSNREKKPRKLILHDSAALNWSEETIEALQHALAQLIDLGFEIYASELEYGKLKPLSKANLFELSSNILRRRMPVCHSDDVLKMAMTNTKFSRNELFVLDNHWIQVLLDELPLNSPRRLSLSDVSVLDEKEQKKLINSLQHSLPPLDKIVHDEFSVKANTAALTLAKAFPNASLQSSYRRLMLDAESLRSLLEKGELTLNQARITLEDCSEVTSLVLSHMNLETSDLDNLLKHFPKLKKLSCKHCKHAELSHYLSFNSSNPEFHLNLLSNLEELDLSSSGSSSDFTNIFRFTSKLKKLVLNGARLKQPYPPASHTKESPQRYNGSFNSYKINHVKELDISCADLSTAKLTELLMHVPNLEILNAHAYQGIFDEGFRLAPNSLPKLKEIDLSKASAFSIENLNTLLSAASNLKILNIRHWKSADMDCRHLSSLEELSLSTTHGLENIIRHAPKLKKIILRNCQENLDRELLERLRLEYYPNISFEIYDDPPVRQKNQIRAIYKSSESKNLESPPEDGKVEHPMSEEKQDPSYRQTSMHNANQPDFKPSPEDGKVEHPMNEEKQDPSYKQTPMHNANQPDFKPSPEDGKVEHPMNEEKQVPNSEQEPIHDANQLKDLKPSPEDKKFEYHGLNKTKNQGMIIEKLSQYLTISHQDLHLIPKIQDGICNALAHYFLIEGNNALEKLLDDVSGWDVTCPPSPELILHFKTLVSYIQDYQLHLKFTNKLYLGDPLSSFLQQLNAPLVFNNPVHAIGIEPRSDPSSWIIYDPEHPTGPKIVSSLEELQNAIKKSLGPLVSVEVPPHHYMILPTQARINNPNHFLKEGGLLVIIQSNKLEQDALLDEIMPHTQFNESALNGLLLRDRRGIPAWASAIKSDNPRLISWMNTLLQQFILQYPNFEEALQKSCEVMTPHQKHECILQLRKFDNKIASTIIPLLRTKTQRDYKELLRSNKPLLQQKGLKEYCMECMEVGPIKKRLIKLNSFKELTGMRFALERQAMLCNRPVYYIHSPEELVCNRPFIKRTGDKGLPDDGLEGGGPLFDFLKANKDKAPLLIINYDNFEAENIAALNAVLGKNQRLINTTPLPEDAIIVGLINKNKPDCYQGSDLYRRVHLHEDCPVATDELLHAIPSLPIVSEVKHQEKGIHLFHAEDWKERLVERCTLSPEGLQFEDGLLESRLSLNPNIKIHNGLWDDPEYQRFWQEAQLHGKIEVNQRIIKIPRNLQLIPEEGYPWDELAALIVPSSSTTLEPILLNPSLFKELFRHLRFNKASKRLESDLGVLENQKAQSPLWFHVTDNLNEDEWAELLLECQRLNIHLKLSLAPGVTLPHELSKLQGIQSLRGSQSTWNPNIREATQIIINTDRDAMIALLNGRSPNEKWRDIDVSGLLSSDLLECVNGGYNQKIKDFDFTHQTSALTKALEKGQRIILHGQFTEELADKLAPVLRARLKEGSRAKGELVIIPEDPNSFQYHLPGLYTYTPSVEEKIRALGDSLSPQVLERLRPYLDEPFCKLRARKTYWETHSLELSSDNAWLGLQSLPPITPLAPFNPKTSEAEAKAFVESRRNLVNKTLKVSPFIYLAGFSGVGKTSFVKNDLCQGKDTPYFVKNLEEDIQEWIEDKSPEGRKLLFIDEANLFDEHWSIFEGLFQDPPRIMFKGKHHTLTKNHKVIFAGNPVSYGDRTLANFFVRHGNSTIFEPIPLACLYENSLKPIFANTILESHQEMLSTIFLEVYRDLVALSKKDVFISPRELQMMALLTLSHCMRHPRANPLAVAKHYAYKLSNELVPSPHKEAFNKQFKAPAIYSQEGVHLDNHFLITKSRLPIYQDLQDLLHLREWRQSMRRGTDEQLYGGLGGIIIEGEPGIGKSELVVHILVANGFKEIHDLKNEVSCPKPFYIMPAGLDQDQKEALLIKAFFEGAVVIMEEINASPPMELLINELTMGTYKNQKPNKPGFLIIGTQNPKTMAGRRVEPTSILRRFIKHVLNHPEDKEIPAILTKEGVPEVEANAMMRDYNTVKKEAAMNHEIPPTLAELITLAENYVVEKGLHANPKRGAPYLPESQEEPIKQIQNAVLQSYLEYSKLQQNSAYSSAFFEIEQSNLDKVMGCINNISNARQLKEASEELIQFLNNIKSIDKLYSFESYLLDNLIPFIKAHDKEVSVSPSDGLYSLEQVQAVVKTLGDISLKLDLSSRQSMGKAFFYPEF